MAETYQQVERERDALKTENRRLRTQLSDAELSLRIYDDMHVSEYWLRYEASPVNSMEPQEGKP